MSDSIQQPGGNSNYLGSLLQTAKNLKNKIAVGIETLTNSAPQSASPKNSDTYSSSNQPQQVAVSGKPESHASGIWRNIKEGNIREALGCAGDYVWDAAREEIQEFAQTPLGQSALTYIEENKEAIKEYSAYVPGAKTLLHAAKELVTPQKKQLPPKGPEFQLASSALRFPIPQPSPVVNAAAPAPSGPKKSKKPLQSKPEITASNKDKDCGVCHASKKSAKNRTAPKKAVKEAPKNLAQETGALAQAPVGLNSDEVAEAVIDASAEQTQADEQRSEPVSVALAAVVPQEASADAVEPAEVEETEPTVRLAQSMPASELSPAAQPRQSVVADEGEELAVGFSVEPNLNSVSVTGDSSPTVAQGLLSLNEFPSQGFVDSEKIQNSGAVDRPSLANSLVQGAIQYTSAFTDRVYAAISRLSPKEAKEGVRLGLIARGPLTEHPGELGRRVIDLELEKEIREGRAVSLSSIPFSSMGQVIFRNDSAAIVAGDLGMLVAKFDASLHSVHSREGKGGSDDQGRDRPMEKIYANELAFIDEVAEEALIDSDLTEVRNGLAARDIVLIS